MSRSAGGRKNIPGPCRAQALTELQTHCRQPTVRGPQARRYWLAACSHLPTPTSIHWATLSSRSSEKVSLR